MYLFYIISAFFAFVGIISLIEKLAKAILRQKNGCCKNLLVLAVTPDSDIANTELSVKLAVSRLDWYRESDYDKIIAVNCSDEPMPLISNIFNQRGIEMINLKELQTHIKY